MKRDSMAAHAESAERIGDLIEDLVFQACSTVSMTKVEEIADQWLAKAKLASSDGDDRLLIMEAHAFALELLVFTPSPTGVTPVGRLIRQHKASAGADQAAAIAVLEAARHHILRLSRPLAGPASEHVAVAEDLATGARIEIMDADLARLAPGTAFLTQLGRSPGGQVLAVGSLTPLDAAALEVAQSFVRPGRGLGNPLRCAAAVFKHRVRHGGPRVVGMNDLAATDEAFEDGPNLSPVDLLANAWVMQGIVGAPPPEILEEARRLTSAQTLIHALQASVVARGVADKEVVEAYAGLAFIQLETLHRRALAGAGQGRNAIDGLAGILDRAVAEGLASADTRALFEALRHRVLASATAPNGDAGPGAAATEELARVLKLIQALRARTVERGCTEQEAMASAGKVAELLDRYGLSLSEIDIRAQVCEGVGIETTRRRRAPLDDCVTTIAAFCDCKVWTETTEHGALRYVYFGLPADVQAAHYLYDLIDATFEAETTRFRAGSVYVRSPERRKSLNSFQTGLSYGIVTKLTSLKAERDATNRRTSGRDLVPVKASVIDEELEKLGLAFESRGGRRSKAVVTDAYEAGRAAGRRFEVEARLGREVRAGV